MKKNLSLNAKLADLSKKKDYKLIYEKEKEENLPVFSSGSLIIDSLTGFNGYPTNSIIEIFGHPSTGKTTLALHAIKSLQNKQKKIVFFDVERTLNLNYAEKIGVNLANLVVLRPKNAEETFDLIIDLLETDEIALVIIDSVAALLPEAEKKNTMSENTIGLQARIMSKALRKINFLLTDKHASIIFINQIREKIKMFFGNPETTTGGNALKFYASLRLQLKPKGKIVDQQNQQVGIKIEVKIVKNKFFSPFTTGLISIFFGKGILFYDELFELAVNKKLIFQHGSWYYYQDQKLAQGKTNTLLFLQKNFKITKLLQEKLF